MDKIVRMVIKLLPPTQTTTETEAANNYLRGAGMALLVVRIPLSGPAISVLGEVFWCTIWQLKCDGT